jgi:hypothetical protein
VRAILRQKRQRATRSTREVGRSALSFVVVFPPQRRDGHRFSFDARLNRSKSRGILFTVRLDRSLHNAHLIAITGRISTV